MCGRYYLAEQEEEDMLEFYIRQARARAERFGVEMVSSGEIRPTNIVPVIAPDSKERKPAAYPMKWGFRHPNKDLLIYNARSETAPEKAFYATSTEDRRCLIPATCYYEWKKEDGKKIRYSFKPADGHLFLAGLYIRSSAERIPCFSILTKDASEDISFIHKRMPVIIPEDRIGEWLSSDNAYTDVIRIENEPLHYQESQEGK